MARKLPLRQKQLLVAFHVLAAMALFGGMLSMLLLQFYVRGAANGEQLAYTLSSMHVIDETLIKFPALATLISGVVLSMWTQWGLVKYYWIILKLALTVVVILVGIGLINPLFSTLAKTVDLSGFASLQRPDFQATSLSLASAAIFNSLAMVTMTIVTYCKPFGRRGSGRQKAGERLNALQLLELPEEGQAALSGFDKRSR